MRGNRVPDGSVRERAAVIWAMFGIGPDHLAGHAARLEAVAARLARELARRLPPRGIALVVGPSGSGKSTLLRHLVRHIRTADPTTAIGLPRRLPTGRPVIACVRGPVASALSLLARAGLGDAPLLLRPPETLSDGQRERLRLALAMQQAVRRARSSSRTPARTRVPVLIADEFGSRLDAMTARCVGACLARWVRHPRTPPLRVVLASPRDDLAPALRPDAIVRHRLAGEPLVTVTWSRTRRVSHPAPVRRFPHRRAHP